MPTVVTEPPPPAETHPKVWTRTECEALQRAGLDLGRYELIDGELIKKMAKRVPHMASAALFQRWLVRTFGDLCVLSGPSIIVSPADNQINEPEPDFLVINKSILELQQSPAPDDILLIIEISESSLGLDRGAKPFDEGRRLPRLLAVLSAQRQGQTDDDELGLLAAHERNELVEACGVVDAGDRGDRPGDRPRRI